MQLKKFPDFNFINYHYMFTVEIIRRTSHTVTVAHMLGLKVAQFSTTPLLFRILYRSLQETQHCVKLFHDLDKNSLLKNMACCYAIHVTV